MASKIYATQWKTPFEQAPARTFNRGEKIILQGKQTDHVYYIKKGKIRFTVLTAEGHEKTLFLLHEGGIFGEMSSFTGRAYGMTAEANEPSEVAVTDADSFLTFLMQEPERLKDWMNMQAEIMEYLIEQIMDVTYLQRESLVCKYLARLSDNYGVATDDGLLIDTRITHQLIADIIGCSRVTVSKIFAKLIQSGAIGKAGGRFVIRDMKRLLP